MSDAPQTQATVHPEPIRPHAAAELCRDLEATPSVLSVEILRPRESPSGDEELTAVVEATPRGTVPLSVIHRCTRAGLGPLRIETHQNPDYKRAVFK